jgi:tetratricopeptide (TPR) repeat protein
MGTPQYMAPEQYLCTEIGPRTDQFSFCVALYEALYGVPPFQGKSLAALAHQVTQGLVPPIPRETRVPAWLSRLVLRGLRTDPEDRFPSMAALLAELGRDPGRARRRASLLGGAILLLVLTGLALRGLRPAAQPCRGAERQLAAIWDEGRRKQVRAAFLATSRPYAADTWRSVARALDAYTGAWVAMHTEACLATHERGKQSPALLDLRMQCLDRRLQEVASLTALLSRADDAVLQKANEAAHGLPPLATCADAAALTAKVPPPEDTATRAQVQRAYRQLSEAEALGRVGKYAEGLKGAQAVAQAARQIGYAPLLAEALTLRGDLEERTGDLSAAAQTVHQAGLAGIAGRHHKAAAQAFALQAFLVGYQQDRPDEGRRWAELAQATLQGTGGDEAIQASLLNVLGMLAHKRGQEEEAAAHLQQALSIRKRILGPEHPEVAAVINNIALVRQRQERHDEAQALYLEALRLTEQGLGPNHPALASCHYNLGLTMATAGKMAEALASFQRALAVSEGALGADHVTSAAIHKELGDVLEDLGRAEEAEAHFLAALSIRQRRLGPESPQVAVVHSNLGHLLREEGRHAEALVHDRQALALREKHLSAASPDLSAELLDVGSDLLGLGRRDEAAALFRRALQLQAAHPDATARKVSPLLAAEARFALARALWPSRRDRAEAARLRDEARDIYARSSISSTPTCCSSSSPRR